MHVDAQVYLLSLNEQKILKWSIDMAVKTFENKVCYNLWYNKTVFQAKVNRFQ